MVNITIDTGTTELLCHIEDHVGVITLNKPEKKNALGDVLTPALRRTLLLLETDPRAGCILITGAGNAFCSGGDVSGMSVESKPQHKQERIAELLHKQMTLTQRLHHLNKVTIAALPGAAAGAGLSIALACDLRIASENAFITTAFRNIGLSGDYGASWFLPRLIGMGKAKELFYRSARVNAIEAEHLGIFNCVFPQTSFRADMMEYAKQIANGPTNALSRMKLNLNASLDQSLSESLALEAKHLIDSAGTPESKEAISAFMQKRQPQFRHTAE
ncbi:MAG: enoyl-CoA hydratase-related protein [Oceanicoccus sp.]